MKQIFLKQELKTSWAFNMKRRTRLKEVGTGRVVSPSVIRTLRKTLRGIESGEVTGVAIITRDRNGGVSSNYSGTDPFALIGAVDITKKRMADEMVYHESS